MASVSQDDKGPGAPLPPTLLFVVGFLLGWWLHRALPFSIDGDGLGPVQALIGMALIVVGAVVFSWGLKTFSGRTGIMLQRPADTLVTSGPYQWSRNPMYVGYAGIYVGAAIVANTVWPLFVLPLVMITVIVAVIVREEGYLRSKFGDTYEAYCRRVGRWL
jgi:protein-S-isoprenylcysteine O-methyltransferase Ste14